MGPLHGPVKLGMAGQAEIVIERRSILALFLRQVHQAVSFG